MNIADCFRLATIFSGMEFTAPAARTKSITYDQAQAICEKAAENGLLSIAIAQALQFDLTLRQIDVIGRWETSIEAETGGILDRGQRWVDGLLWSHIDPDGVLSKPTSKTGQTAEHDTRAYPMLRQLLDMIPQEKTGRAGCNIRDDRPSIPISPLLQDLARSRDGGRCSEGCLEPRQPSWWRDGRFGCRRRYRTPTSSCKS